MRTPFACTMTSRSIWSMSAMTRSYLVRSVAAAGGARRSAMIFNGLHASHAMPGVLARLGARARVGDEERAAETGGLVDDGERVGVHDGRGRAEMALT